MKTQIPDVIIVSVFHIKCKEIKSHQCEKYYMMSKALIDMIAKNAKLSIQKIFNEFQIL